MNSTSAALEIELTSRINVYLDQIKDAKEKVENGGSDVLITFYKGEIERYETKLSEVEDLYETAKRYIFK